MRLLARSKFFEKHPTFGIESPNRAFLFGRNVVIRANEIGWYDGRSRGITVRRVGESSEDRLVVWDSIGRRIEFVPVTAEWYNRVMAVDGESKSVKTDAEALKELVNSPYDW